MVLVVALAAATVWFVALPALEQAPKRSCEVILLKSGSTRCVAQPVLASRLQANAKTARKRKQ